MFSKQSKISTLAKDWIEEGYHDPKIDFYNLFYELIFATGISNALQDFAWERISLRDAEEKSMLDRFNIDDYRNLFFHSRSHFRNVVIEAYKNRQSVTIVSYRNEQVAHQPIRLQILFSNRRTSNKIPLLE